MTADNLMFQRWNRYADYPVFARDFQKLFEE